MSRRKKIELKDELDDDLNFEGESEAGKSFCAREAIKPWIWALGIMVVIVVLFAFFSKKPPSPKEVTEAWGEPEKTAKLFGIMVAQSVQAAAWVNPGRVYSCPNCGWKGTRLGIDSIGNQVCPNCFYRPFTRNVFTGKGVAAVAGASPQAHLVRKLGMEVIDTQRGVLVAQAYKGSWAQKGGLKHGDILLKFNHKKVGTSAQFQKIVMAAPSEKRVPVKVFRLGSKVRLNVMVGEGELEGVILPGQAGAAAAWAPGGQGRMGGFGLGPGGYVVCLNCGFKMLHQRGTAYDTRCPKCGSIMIREEILNQSAQAQNPWEQ